MPPRRKATRKKASVKKRNSAFPGWIWMLTGLAIGLSATFLPEIFNAERLKENPTETTTSTGKRSFDFYTLLPELEMVVDPPSKNKKASPKKQQSTSNAQYYLQAGSFKNNSDADSLKAQLAMMGVVTNIETVSVNSTKWHRVRVGPSRDLNQLQTIQERLRKQRIDSMLLKARN